MTWENVPEYIYLNCENNMTRRRQKNPTTVSGRGVVSVDLRENHDLQTVPKADVQRHNSTRAAYNLEVLN